MANVQEITATKMRDSLIYRLQFDPWARNMPDEFASPRRNNPQGRILSNGGNAG
jgi:hypothetical protein